MVFFTKRYHSPGTSPGTLAEASREETTPPRIRLIDYDSEQIEVHNDIDPSKCRAFLDKASVTWVHVEGRPTSAALEHLGEAFDLHPLAMEDVINIGQRPKLEPFDDQLFIVLGLPLMHEDSMAVHQVSFFLHKTFLVSFCEHDVAIFKPIVERLRANGSRLRSQSADYLLYSLIDVVIDQGFPLLEDFGFRLEKLEEQILQGANAETLGKIHLVKRDLILLRRTLWPQREVINKLLRDDEPLIQQGTLIYLRDCYDHTVQIMDLLETYRDMSSSMLDIYLSSVSNRMNEIMRLLTVISTIFIPLTFLTSLYGMNFDRTASSWNMPELGWPFGYLVLWLLMILVVAAMLFVFRRRGWF